MLFNFKHLVKLNNLVSKTCGIQNSFLNNKIQNGLKCILPENHIKNFHTDMPRNKYSNVLDFRRSQIEAKNKLKIKEPFEEDLSNKRFQGYFPTVDLPNTLFNNIPYKNLPVVYIKTSRNNTIMSLSDNGFTKILRSCGTEGFKNARKGTNVAAQTTGTSFAMRAVKKGYKAVRVILDGLGPGRLSSIKGLQLGGIDVVSITDNTTDFTSNRPRKQKRL